MKILTVLGTRPEIIRLSRLIPLLDKYSDHKIIYTSQNYEKSLSDIFFKDLGLRRPDYNLDVKTESPMAQIGKILSGVEKIMTTFKPDRLVILGDTNSAISAFAAKRMGIKVFHMEAGNRCYDDRVPEEVNRRVIDHSSDILMPYTERSRANLIAEGIPGERIFVTGNPIKEVLDFYEPQITKSQILQKLKLENGKYFLVTLHRAENVDVKERLANFLESFNRIGKKYNLPIVYSLHPRTKYQLKKQKQKIKNKQMIILEPLGLFDFVKLEKNAFTVLSDSGTVQEECAIFKIPVVTLRDVTERPETLEVGSNFLAGCNPSSILSGVKIAKNLGSFWEAPREYLTPNASMSALKIILGYYK